MFMFFGGWMAGILSVILFVAAVVDLVVGIIGVKKAGDPSGATFFIVFGIILTVLSAVSLFSMFNVWNLLGLVMPVLLIVGGFMNKKALQTA